SLDPAAARRLWERKRRLEYLLSHYVPKVYDGEITLFRARKWNRDVRKMLSEWRVAGRDEPYFRTNGWQPYSTKPIQIDVVPGMHEELVLEPHVGTLARRFKARLDRAVAGRRKARSLLRHP